MCGALVAGSASAQSRTACRAVKLRICKRAGQGREGKGKKGLGQGRFGSWLSMAVSNRGLRQGQDRAGQGCAQQVRL
jgi:hypothetical protein